MKEKGEGMVVSHDIVIGVGKKGDGVVVHKINVLAPTAEDANLAADESISSFEEATGIGSNKPVAPSGRKTFGFSAWNAPYKPEGTLKKPYCVRPDPSKQMVN